MNQYESTVTTPTEQEDIDTLVTSSNQLHTTCITALTNLQSAGIKLGDMLTEHSSKHPPPKTFSLDVMGSPNLSRQRRMHSGSTSEIVVLSKQKGTNSLDEIDGQVRREEKRNSWDILDSKHEPIVIPEFVTKPPTDSPKLLVAPRRAKTGGMKSAKSMPALGPATKDQETIDHLLEVASKRASEMEELWTDRNKQLEELKEMASYRENVPKVIEWVKTVGDKFLERKNALGGSIEEVMSVAT